MESDKYKIKGYGIYLHFQQYNRVRTVWLHYMYLILELKQWDYMYLILELAAVTT